MSQQVGSPHQQNDKAPLTIPEHLAIIMDGNSRWAKRRGKTTSSGHKAGVEAVREVLRLATDYGIRIVTLYAFSSENWQRPALEVKALMTLLSTYLKSEARQLHEDGVQIRFIGARDKFSKGLRKQIEQAEALTAENTQSVLVLAVDYGGQWDIANAAKQLARQVQAGELDPESIDADMLGQHIAMSDLPPPDLCIRTAGEQRLSNFLLWQLAYAEYFFTETLWPDFGAKDMARALEAYSERDRRFGGRNDESSQDVEAS